MSFHALARCASRTLPASSSSPCHIRHLASSATQLPAIGFIGVGLMGLQMSSNLARNMQGKFSELILHDLDKTQTLDRFAKNVKEHKEIAPDVKDRIIGATTFADSAADVAARASVIFTMLPTAAHVRDVYLGSSGRARAMIEAARADTLLIDSSTIDKETIALVSAEFSRLRRGAVIDAPVSGGVVGARNATLTFMVGGGKDTLERATPWLSAMGKRVVHCGRDVGMGQVAKICNNMLLGATMVATCEALNLGRRCGLDPKLLASIINTSSGRSWSSDTNNPVPGVVPGAPAGNNYEGGFGIKLMQKDMGLALDMAHKAHGPVFLSSVASQVFKQVMNTAGNEKKDFSVVYAWLEQSQE